MSINWIAGRVLFSSQNIFAQQFSRNVLCYNAFKASVWALAGHTSQRLWNPLEALRFLKSVLKMGPALIFSSLNLLIFEIKFWLLSKPASWKPMTDSHQRIIFCSMCDPNRPWILNIYNNFGVLEASTEKQNWLCTSN